MHSKKSPARAPLRDELLEALALPVPAARTRQQARGHADLADWQQQIVGVPWRQSSRKTVSVSTLAGLDELIGLKG